MIAFHLILSAYGFWLPNDPRGSWSDFVGAWELYKFGPATKVNDARNYAKDPHDRQARLAAKRALKYPPVRFNNPQRHAIAAGFSQACAQSNYHCLACCIGHDHSHLIFHPHPRDIPTLAGHLKSAATRHLTTHNLHPLTGYTGKRGTLPTPWSEGSWKVFIETHDQLHTAIAYVDDHPRKEMLPMQRWDFVIDDPTPSSPR